MEFGIVDEVESESYYEYHLEYQWFDPSLEEWVKGAPRRYSEGIPRWFGPDETIQSRRMKLLAVVFDDFGEMRNRTNIRELRLYRRLVTYSPWDEVFGKALSKISPSPGPEEPSAPDG